MSEEKGTYETSGKEWDSITSALRVLMNSQTPKAVLLPFAVVELARAIRDFPRLWMEAVKKAG